jgi:hypothetical protein
MTEEGHTVCLPRVPGRLTLDEASILDVVISQPTMAQPSAPSSGRRPGRPRSSRIDRSRRSRLYDVGNDRKALLEATLSDVIAHLLGVRSPPSRLPTRSMITGRHRRPGDGRAKPRCPASRLLFASLSAASDALKWTAYRSLIDDDQFPVSRQTFAANAIRIPCSLTRVFSR